jgi:hypothetical protein
MQLMKGGWNRMEASWSARLVVNQARVVRPSQLIASVKQWESSWISGSTSLSGMSGIYSAIH